MRLPAPSPDEQGRSSVPPDVPGYEPPAVVWLGSLAELTRGGTVGPDDGVGGAGDMGSLP